MNAAILDLHNSNARREAFTTRIDDNVFAKVRIKNCCMKRLDRIVRIMELLEGKGNASTAYLSKSLGISESSVRRDINHMVTLPKYPDVKRVHGGVVLERSLEGLEYMFELKLDRNRRFKQSVAAEAGKLIHDGDSIIIDSGTTCLYLAQLLHERNNLKVVTTDVKIAEELGKNGNIESNIIGGVVRPGYYTLGGIVALENLDRFIGGVVFMSVDAIDSEYGITNASEFEVGVKQRLIRMGKQVYVLADYTKFDTHSLYKVADIAEVDMIISNESLSESTAEQIRDRGVELVLV